MLWSSSVILVSINFPYSVVSDYTKHKTLNRKQKREYTKHQTVNTKYKTLKTKQIKMVNF